MDWAAVHWVDILFLVVLIFGGVVGLLRGLSHELAMLIGMIVAVAVTFLLYRPLSDWICAHVSVNEEIVRLISVVALVAAALAGMKLLRAGLGLLMTFSFKGPVERVGGVLAGILRRGAVFLVLLLAASFVPWNWLQRPVMYDSQVGQLILPQVRVGYNALARKMEMIQAEVPIGVELPFAVMPPDGEGGGTWPPEWPEE